MTHYSPGWIGVGGGMGSWGGGRGWGAWRAHAHFVAFRAELKGYGEQGEAAVEELTLRLSRERRLLCKHDFLLGTKLPVFTAEVSLGGKRK